MKINNIKKKNNLWNSHSPTALVKYTNYETYSNLNKTQ